VVATRIAVRMAVAYRRCCGHGADSAGPPEGSRRETSLQEGGLLGIDTLTACCGVIHSSADAQFSRPAAPAGNLAQITSSRTVQLAGNKVQFVSRITVLSN
jgi:hypothetical protein